MTWFAIICFTLFGISMIIGFICLFYLVYFTLDMIHETEEDREKRMMFFLPYSEKIKIMEKQFVRHDLSKNSKELPKVTIQELIDRLNTLPKNQEIIICPNGKKKYRFNIDNICQMENDNGYQYCAILF